MSKTLSKASVVVLIFTLALVGGAAKAMETQEVEVQTSIGEDHIMSRMMDKFAELVGDYSDGEIKITVRYGAPFGELYDVSEQVGRGILPMTGGLLIPELDDRFNLAILGGLVTDWDAAKRIYGPGGPMQELLRGIGEDVGVVALATAPTGFGGTIFKGDAPSSLPSDTAYVVRVPPYDGFEVRMRALGFDPVVMPFGDVYTAMQTGTLDGKSATPPEEVAQVFGDITDAYVLDRSYFENLWSILVSSTWLDGLSADAREAVEQAGKEASEWAWEEGERAEMEALSQVKDKGIKIIKFSDDEYDKIVEITRSNEWPAVEKLVGSELMDRVRAMVSD